MKPPIFPTDHWHFGVVNENIVINTLTGDLNKAVILRKNQERLTCGSRCFLAQRYSYTGDLKTDVWYDQKNAGWACNSRAVTEALSITNFAKNDHST